MASRAKSGSSSASSSTPLPIAETGPIRSWQSRAASNSSTRRSIVMALCWHAREDAAITAWSTTAAEQRRGAIQILRPVGVEEWIDAGDLLGKRHRRERVARGPHIDLAD